MGYRNDGRDRRDHKGMETETRGMEKINTATATATETETETKT